MDRDEEPRESACSGLPKINGVPEFHSELPPSLLEKLPKKDRELFTTMSMVKESTDKAWETLVRQNEALLKLCRWQDKVERRHQFWVARFGWIWGALALLGSAFAGAFARALVERFWK